MAGSVALDAEDRSAFQTATNRRTTDNDHARTHRPPLTAFRRLSNPSRREVRKRYDEGVGEKTCEEEPASQRPSNFGKNLKIAMDSLIKHPASVEDAASMLRVNGLGPKIAEIVMSVGLFANDRDDLVDIDGDDRDDPDQSQPSSQQQNQKQKQMQKKKKEYVPRLGSANYAFLIVLYRELHDPGRRNPEEDRQHLTKKELMELAEASGLSSNPINSMGGGSARVYGAQASKTYYNGWSNFKALVNNDLVRAWGVPKKIALTDAGLAVARRLNELTNDDCVADGCLVDDTRASVMRDTAPHDGRPVVCERAMPTGAGTGTGTGTVDGCDASTASAEVVMLIDSREQYARSFVDKLSGAEIRTLAIGDVLWIARNGQEEYVLDYVLERKSIEDLISSVRGGSRYHSQKYRLQQCGIRNLYYLVEGDVESLSSSTDYKLVGTACAKTSIIDHFNVLRPKSFAGTLALLSRMTRSIRKRMMTDMMTEGSSGASGPGGASPLATWARRNGLMTFDEFQARCVGLQKGSNTVQEVWSVMLNEVPGLGRWVLILSSMASIEAQTRCSQLSLTRSLALALTHSRRVAVEGRVFSDPRHRTCHGFYAGMVKGPGAVGGGSEPPPASQASTGSKASSKKIESILNALFYTRR